MGFSDSAMDLMDISMKGTSLEATAANAWTNAHFSSKKQVALASSSGANFAETGQFGAAPKDSGVKEL
jgi:hypothetical protein